MQFVVAAGLFAVMMTWSFAAGYSNSIVSGHVEMMQRSLDSHRNISAKYDHYNQVYSLLEERAGRLDRLDPKISITGILAELSYIATDSIMLTDLNLNSEIYKSQTDTARAAGVRLSSPQSGEKIAMPAPEVRYKLTVDGIASKASSVTDLISEMEKSDYFCLVVPGLLEHRKDDDSTRFEISCYIANYIVEDEH